MREFGGYRENVSAGTKLTWECCRFAWERWRLAGVSRIKTE
jgi:hypothetical protein